jgi:hypothetical protein
MISNLNANTDLGILKKASELSVADSSRITELDEEIFGLKTKNIPQQMANFEKTIGDLNGLRSQIDIISSTISDEFISKIRGGINEYNEADSLVKKIGIDQFKQEYFTQTGTEAWYDFVKAAKSLAEKEQVDHKPYPQKDDRCLLCHQSLSKEARKLLLKLWEFLEGEAQAALKKANISLNSHKEILSNTALDFFSEQAVSYRYLEEHDGAKGSDVAKTISSFVNDCRKRVSCLIRMIDDKDSKARIQDLPKSGADLIELVVGSLTND